MIFGIYITVIHNHFYHIIHNLFLELAKIGIFFFIYIIIVLFILPGLSLNLVVHRKNSELKETKKRDPRKDKNRSILLLAIGLPLMVWAIIGSYRYYILTEYYGGLGELALNGFLVLLQGIIFIFIIPGLIIGIKSYFENKHIKSNNYIEYFN